MYPHRGCPFTLRIQSLVERSAVGMGQAAAKMRDSKDIGINDKIMGHILGQEEDILGGPVLGHVEEAD